MMGEGVDSTHFRNMAYGETQRNTRTLILYIVLYLLTKINSKQFDGF